MNNEEIFKNNLHEKLSDQHFEMDPDNWRKMELLIDGKKKKRRALILLLSGIALIGGVAALFLPGNLITQTADNSLENKLPTASPKNAQKPGADLSAAKIPVQSVTTPEKPQALRPSVPIAEVKDRQKIQNHTEASPAPAQTKPGLQLIDKQQDTAPNDPERNPVREKVETLSMPEPAIAGNTTGTKPDKRSDTMENGISEQPMSAAPEQAMAIPDGQPESVTVQTDAVSDSINSDVTRNTHTTAITGPDSTATQTRSDSDYVGRKYPDLIVEGGTNYCIGWRENQGRDARGFNPLAGIHYQKEILPGLRLSLGIQYTSISNIRYSNYTSRIVDLDFGVNSKVTSFNPRTLHYICLPVHVQFDLNDKSTIGGGMQFWSLLTVNSEIITYNEDRHGQSDFRSHKETGYTQGFNNKDIRLALFYRYRITSRISANAELNLGFVDVKTGEYLPSENRELGHSLRLSLIYKIFKQGK